MQVFHIIDPIRSSRKCLIVTNKLEFTNVNNIFIQCNYIEHGWFDIDNWRKLDVVIYSRVDNYDCDGLIEIESDHHPHIECVIQPVIFTTFGYGGEILIQRFNSRLRYKQ
jgi:hypothetical protein